MSEDFADPSASPVELSPTKRLSPARRSDRASQKVRTRRGPTPAEIALLRWLVAKPRPVTAGPIGNCVKRGWCQPVRAVVEDYDGRRVGFVYVVTEAGSLLLLQHEPVSAAAMHAHPADGETPPKISDTRPGGPKRGRET